MCAELTTRRRPRRAPQRGLSIVELMVGIVVSLLVGLAAAGSAIMFTASQRQGMGAGGTSVNGAAALTAVKDEAALAGLGFFGESAYLCRTMHFSVEAAALMDGVAFSPVRITEEGADDRVDVLYATSVAAGANVLLNSPSNGLSAELMSYLPATVGQAVLLAPDPAAALPWPGCMVRSVTAVTPSTETTPQLLSFANTGTHNKVAFAAPPVFPAEARVTLLGALNWSRFRRIGTNLVMERPIQGDSVTLARNVMALRMQYGIAAAAVGSTTLEAWQDASGAFAAVDFNTLPRVRALRIGMVTRSPQREKPNAAGVCESTEALPTLFGEAIVADVADWSCYRFRVSTVVVPLRNLVYGFQ